MSALVRFALCLVLSLACAASAIAAEPPAATRAKTSRIHLKNSGEIRLATAANVGPTDLGTTHVDGKIAKPGLYIIFPRAAIRWADLHTHPDFVPRIAREAQRHAP